MWNQGRGPGAGVRRCVGWELLILEVGEEGGGGGEAALEGEEGGAQGGEGGGGVAQEAVGEVEGGQEFGTQARRGGEWCVGGRRVGGCKPSQEEGQRLVVAGAVGSGGAPMRIRAIGPIGPINPIGPIEALGAEEGEEAALDVGVEDVVDGARTRGESLQGYVAGLDADGRGEVAVADLQGDAAGRRAALAHDAAYDAAEWAVDYANGVGRGQVNFAGGVDGEVVGLGGGDAPEGLYGRIAECDVSPSALGRGLGGSVNHGVDLGARRAERAQLGGRSAQKGIVEQQGHLHAARATALGAVEAADARGKELWRSIFIFRTHGGDGALQRLGGGPPAVGFTYGD